MSFAIVQRAVAGVIGLLLLTTLVTAPAKAIENPQLFAETVEAAQTTGVDIELTPGDDGYWIIDDVGRVFTFGNAPYLGGSPPLIESETAISLDPTPSGLGYRIFTSDGRVHAYGDADHLGDLAGINLAGAIVDTASTSTGGGYYMLGSEGGVFAFGDAAFLGSIQQMLDDFYGGVPAVDWLDQPIVSIAATETNGGYWLVGADGGMFTFGDAMFHGSVPGVLAPGSILAGPVVGALTQGNGYLMVGADGGIFNFGSSPFHGSIPGLGAAAPTTSVQLINEALITSVAATPSGSGYAMLGASGTIWPFGSLATVPSAFASIDLSIPADPGDTTNCSDFATVEAAQLWFDQHRPFHGDTALIDTDGDGSPCEPNDELVVEGTLTTVTRIVDGDTIEVLLEGSREKVRLIGINTPETNECLGTEAGDRLSDLVLDKQVILVSDRDDRDQFGRLLRYVFLGAEHINARLVGEGMALAVEFAPNTARSTELAARQVAARNAQIGLWAPDTCGEAATNDLRIITVHADAPGNDNDNLNGEWVSMTNDGPTSADLTGWILRDNSSSHRYSFPSGFALTPGATIRVFTGCGVDDFDSSLYWCKTRSAVWNNSGDTAFLLDPSGNVHSSFSY